MSAFSEHMFSAPDGVRTYYRRYPAEGGERGVPVLCMHGLTRNSKDFEDVCPRLAARGRTVLAVDVRGRGRSDRDPNPENYRPDVYAQDMAGLLDAAGVERFDALGTSMGGLMTMLLAAMVPGRLNAAALNDIGPVIDPKGLSRIQGYVGGGGPFDSWEDAADAIRAINGVAFPNETGDAFWMTFARRTCRERPDGRIELDYDPAISAAVKAGEAAPPALWDLFDALGDKPLLLVRGALTDLLSKDTVAEMKRRKPHMVHVDVPNVGHAPTLSEPAAVAALNQFFGAR